MSVGVVPHKSRCDGHFHQSGPVITDRPELFSKLLSRRIRVQVEITCRHGSIGPDFQEYVQRKTQKLQTYFERVTTARVTFHYEGDRVQVEILVNPEHKQDFVTSTEGPKEDAGALFDATLAKMDQLIRKHKEKIQDHRRNKPTSEVVTDGLESEQEGSSEAQ
jgi:putative sigma-54 modulation protein